MDELNEVAQALHGLCMAQQGKIEALGVMMDAVIGVNRTEPRTTDARTRKIRHNGKVDQTLLHLQAEIGKYLPGYIPDSAVFTELKDEIFAFMKDNVTTLKNASSDIFT